LNSSSKTLFTFSIIRFFFSGVSFTSISLRVRVRGGVVGAVGGVVDDIVM
jgi:hypothetical protein